MNKNKTNVMHKNRMPYIFKFGLSMKVTKMKAEKIRERDEREALRKKQKLDNFIINIADDDIDFGGLGVGGDTVEDGENVPLLALPPYDYRIAQCFLSRPSLPGRIWVEGTNTASRISTPISII